MSTAAKVNEPTMEEILASIRRIISDDEPGQPMAPKPSIAKAVEPDAKFEAGKPDVTRSDAAKSGAAAPAMDAEDAANALGQDDIDAMFASFDAPEPPAAKIAPEPAPVVAAPQPAPPVGAAADDIDVFDLTEEMAEEPFSPPPIAKPEPAARPEPALRAPEPVVAPPRPEQRWDAPAPSFAATVEDRLLSTSANDAVTGAFGTLANTILANNARTLDDIVKDMLRPMLRAWLDDNLPPLVERLVKQEIERVARGGR